MQIDRPQPKQPRPADAQKVFSGVIYDVYQWQQQVFDGSKQTFETLARADTVNVIAVTSQQKIVLTKQEQPGKAPFIGMLGGRADKGEQILAAAKRELLEESGLASDQWSLLMSQQVLTKIDWAVFTFVARDVYQLSSQKLDAGEKIELIEYSWDEFVEVVTNPDYYDVEIINLFLRAKLDPMKMAELKQQILG